MFTGRSSPRTLTIGGGFEFMAAGATTVPEGVTPTQLFQAYTALDYDLFVLTPEEGDLLAASGHALPPSWHVAGQDPKLVTHTLPRGELAFVLFPHTLSEKTENALLDMVQTLRRSHQFQLVIGISTWGYDREMEFLQRQGQAFDIVLGAGDGPGFPGLYLQNNTVLWSRAPGKGKDVNVIAIPDFPPTENKITWSPEKSISAMTEALRNTIAPNPEIAALFASHP